MDDIIAEINENIVANGNEEITADVLRPILLGICNAVLEITGDKTNLETTDKTNLVAAINEVREFAEEKTGVVVHTGTADPNDTPPADFKEGDYYLQTLSGKPIGFYIYNGLEWYPLFTIES